MSVRNFERVFTREVGTAPAHYVLQMRVEAARRDLECTQKRLKQIASAAGFGNVDVAEAGLLNGRTATTHWRFGREMASRFPAVRLQHDPLWVKDGNVYTSAGISAGAGLRRVVHGTRHHLRGTRRRNDQGRVMWHWRVYRGGHGQIRRAAYGHEAARVHQGTLQELSQCSCDDRSTYIEVVTGKCAASPLSLRRS